MESAHDILYTAEVDARLTAYGRIHLRKQGSGDIVKIDTAHICGSNEAAYIANHAAAYGNDAILTAESGS